MLTTINMFFDIQVLYVFCWASGTNQYPVFNTILNSLLEMMFCKRIWYFKTLLCVSIF